ncbi:MAG: 6-carboxytetrahydropterin synthase [Exilibacterium sp.]
MSRLTTITLSKEYLKFSAAHFTIFSATSRERLHGHNFSVAAAITAPVGDNGMCFSYKVYKQKLEQLCAEMDEYLLIPTASPFLTIGDEGDYHRVEFNGEIMLFLKSDTRLLPIRNTTVEEYSQYLLDQLVRDTGEIEKYDLRKIVIEVFSGPGQSGSSLWERNR